MDRGFWTQAPELWIQHLICIVSWTQHPGPQRPSLAYRIQDFRSRIQWPMASSMHTLAHRAGTCMGSSLQPPGLYANAWGWHGVGASKEKARKKAAADAAKTEKAAAVAKAKHDKMQAALYPFCGIPHDHHSGVDRFSVNLSSVFITAVWTASQCTSSCFFLLGRLS